MLNAVKLSELLAKNVDPHLYPRMFVMSPNGTLMAYSTPVDIKDLRDQAALVSMAWKEHETTIQGKQTGLDSGNPSSQKTLETLTIEFQHNNIIVRALQPTLLLVMVGGVPPLRKPVFKITPETRGDPRYPATDNSTIDTASVLENDQGPGVTGSSLAPGEHGDLSSGKRKPASITSTLSQREKDIKIGALHIQRKKLDAITNFIRADFDSKGFVMPDDAAFP